MIDTSNLAKEYEWESLEKEIADLERDQ